MGGIIFEGHVENGISCEKRKLWKETSFLVDRFIAKEKLTDIKLRLYQDKIHIKIPPPFPGIPVPHLHRGGKVYQLSQRQWNRFSKMVVRDLKAKMSKIKSVDLEQLSALSAVIKK